MAFYLMKALLKIISISFALSVAQWGPAFGYSFIYPGIQPGTEAGLSQINTRGASSILWNPANLVVTPPAFKSRPDKKTKGRRGVEVYGDVSIMSVNYSYTREGVPPLKVSRTAPPVNLGFSWRPQSRFSLGAFFIPRPSSKSTLTDYPFPEGGSVKPSNVEQSSGSVVSGFGVGIKANPNLSLGLSLIETAETNTLAVYFQDSASDVPFVQLESSGSFIQFLFGVRAKVSSSVTIGASIKTPVTKKYCRCTS